MTPLLATAAIAETSEEGSGGPENWLECGVRYVTPEERVQTLGWSAGTENIEYLSLGSNALHGIQNVVFRNWFEINPQNSNQVIARTEPIGILTPTHTGRHSGDRIHFGRVDIVDGVPQLEAGEGLPIECQPELFCACPGFHAEWRWRISNIAGLLQMADGSSMYIMGKQKEYTLTEINEQNETYSETTFVPILTASTVPLVQDTAAVESWMLSRSLAESGNIDMTVEEVDRLHSIPYQEHNYDGLYTSCIGICMDRFMVEERNALRRLEDRIDRCRDRLITANERMNTHLGTVASCTGISGAVGGIVGGVVGSVFCPGVGTAGGAWLGLKFGAAIGSCVGVIAGVPVCEIWVLDDEAREREVARCEGNAYLDYEEDVRLLHDVLNGCIQNCKLNNRHDASPAGTGR